MRGPHTGRSVLGALSGFRPLERRRGGSFTPRCPPASDTLGSRRAGGVIGQRLSVWYLFLIRVGRKCGTWSDLQFRKMGLARG